MNFSNLSLLQQHRLNYQPLLPFILQDLARVVPEKQTPISELESSMKELFPHATQLPLLLFKQRQSTTTQPLKVGVVLSGGQAPGGHNVITGLLDALKKLHSSSQLLGFLEGPQGIIENKFIELTEESLAPYRNQGGFDLLGSGRTKIETPEQFEAVEHTLKVNHLDGLIIVGGDDSNTNAAFLAEFCQQRGLTTRVLGVPKTIDGDLKNEFIEISFGFDTASKIYSEIIGNLLKDALSAKKYYFFVKMMGRSASHLTLECALQTHVNLALIGEEIAACQQTLTLIIAQIADLICERAKQNKNFGVILIPEGLLEFIPEFQKMIHELNCLFLDSSSFIQQVELSSCAEELKAIADYLTPASSACFSTLPTNIQKQLLLERDSHGNMQLSKIDTEQLLILLVKQELNERKQQHIYEGKFDAQSLFCGYEGRSGLPTNFDCQYCYALGHAAALLVHHGASGYMCCIQNLTQAVEKWEVKGVPIVHMLHFEIRKKKTQAVIQKTLVDIKGPAFSAFKHKREEWRLNDSYCCPGPIQFEGAHQLIDSRPLILRHEHSSKT